LLLANNPQGGEHLKDLLVGQILWVELRAADAGGAAVGAILGCMWCAAAAWPASLSTACSRMAITASVQLVGVYLVFASLIVPALATAGMHGARRSSPPTRSARRLRLGLVLSAVLDLPSGAMIVWTLAGCALLAQAVPAIRARTHRCARPTRCSRLTRRRGRGYPRRAAVGSGRPPHGTPPCPSVAPLAVLRHAFPRPSSWPRAGATWPAASRRRRRHAARGTAAPPASPPERAGPQFADLSKRWLDGAMQLSPVFATQTGDHRFDASSTTSARRSRESLAFSKGLLAELETMDRSKLSRENQVDAATLRNQLRYDVWSAESLQGWAWDPMLYNATAGGALYG
jgi:hypothetical protein